MIENGHEVIESPLESDKLVEISQQAEKRIEAVKKIKTMALRLTNHSDWTDQGGKPYLQVSGSEKVARLFGISWRFLGDIQRKDEEGGHFSFEVSMEFVMPGASVEFRGSRSSKDTFFSTRYKWDDEKKEKIKIELPPSEIDKTDVMKAAITNTIGNGITRLLGIRNLTWKDLEEGGIRQEDVGKVEYKKKGESQGSTTPPGDQSEITAIVDNVTVSEGKNAKTGKPWKKYSIQIGEIKYSTFDEKFATLAKQGKESAVMVRITFKKTTYGPEIISLELQEPREPGQEE